MVWLTYITPRGEDMAEAGDVRQFIADLALPERPHAGGVTAQGGEIAAPVFVDQAKQAVVVGSDVVSFVQGVGAELRDAVTNSLLLAQLAASKKTPDSERVLDWYDAYFDTLRRIGWLVGDSGFSKMEESTAGFEVHEKIMLVAAALLGPATAALAVVQATLDGLKAVGSDNGWITIFDRETLHASAGRFQMAVVEPEAGGEVIVKLMAFAIEAQRTVTQVLFFKIKKSRATLKKSDATVSMAAEGLLDTAPDVRRKVREFQRSFIAEVEI
jgi:hypothetical protein